MIQAASLDYWFPLSHATDLNTGKRDNPVLDTVIFEMQNTKSQWFEMDYLIVWNNLHCGVSYGMTEIDPCGIPVVPFWSREFTCDDDKHFI